MPGFSRKPGLITAEFEVFGRVHAVYFRKYTQKKATDLGLKGWIMITPQGTIVGRYQGPAAAIELMKIWLQKAGTKKGALQKEGQISYSFRTIKIPPDTW